MAYGIKLKLPMCFEGGIEENRRCYVHTATNATPTTTISTTQAKGIKVKRLTNV